MIIFIHCPFPGIFGELVQVVARFAVPFFLIVSGYFAFKGDTVVKAEKKLKDTLRVIVCAAPVCIIWNSVNSALIGNGLTHWMEDYLNLKSLAEFLLFNRAVFLNAVFYYFFALIYVYGIIILACRCGVQKKLFFLILPLLMICLYVLNFTDLPWYYVGNWAFTGLPIFLLGGVIQKNSNVVETLKGKSEVLLLIAGIGISTVEYIYEGLVYLYAGSVLLATSMLVISINHPDCPTGNVGNRFAVLGSRCSLFVVLFHCQIRDTLSIFIQDDGWWLPMLVAVTTLLLAALWTSIGKRRTQVN